jgi:hypothetical protein
MLQIITVGKKTHPDRRRMIQFDQDIYIAIFISLIAIFTGRPKKKYVICLRDF